MLGDRFRRVLPYSCMYGCVEGTHSTAHWALRNTTLLSSRYEIGLGNEMIPLGSVSVRV